MSKYRIVQVAPTTQRKCFRVDQQLASDVLGEAKYETVKIGNRWAFYNTFEEAQSYLDSLRTPQIVVEYYPRTILETEVK